MRNGKWLAVLGLGGLLALVPVRAQVRPYIGYVYPAGGQQGTTFAIRLGGQSMDEVSAVLISGKGVTAKITEYHRRLDNQEQAMIAEQLRDLKRAKKADGKAAKPQPAMQMDMMMTAAAAGGAPKAALLTPEDELIARLEKRVNDFNNTPACASISTILEVEVTMAPDAPPGEREIRVVSTRGVSNPLAFHVGQVPEYTRKPMRTATLQVLGKEAQSLRKRPPEEAEDRVNIPCALNGQIASGEMNLYRFTANAGQRLVISSLARQLVPYVADAVPGWFQPVLVLYDAKGKEVAYDDDYRFKPDPVILFDVPKTGDYVLAIYDAIYRGREDFGYRITVSELPFVTSIFPLGGRIRVHHYERLEPRRRHAGAARHQHAAGHRPPRRAPRQPGLQPRPLHARYVARRFR
ncbi:MAG: PPC domain-containing protein [Kiritimatiellaeota bacterium]|nr:PPC domain-containing protein [Kiritimatiellota bacterium]